MKVTIEFRVGERPATVVALDEQTQSAVILGLTELMRAQEKFPTWPVDPLHACAVLGEEFGELTKAVLEAIYEPKKSSYDDVRAEAVQTIAMALRFLANLDQYDFIQSRQVRG